MNELFTTRFRQTLLCSTVIGAFICLNDVTALGQRAGRPSARTQAARVVIGPYGYEPASIRLKRGVPAKVTFLRTTDSTCATEVVFADYGIRRELPLDRSVTVGFTPRKAGEFSFTCGMIMHRGKLIVY